MGDVTVTREIPASPETVYDLVADLPRMGEWSPECERVEWTGEATAARVGARFTGHNRHGSKKWSTHGEVTAADRGRELAFEIKSVFNLPVARWGYRLESTETGCRVTETMIDRRGWFIRNAGRLATGVTDRDARNHETMTRTLEQLEAAATAAPGDGSAT